MEVEDSRTRTIAYLRLGCQRPGLGPPCDRRLQRRRQVAKRRGGRPLTAGGRSPGKVRAGGRRRPVSREQAGSGMAQGGPGGGGGSGPAPLSSPAKPHPASRGFPESPVSFCSARCSPDSGTIRGAHLQEPSADGCAWSTASCRRRRGVSKRESGRLFP